MIAALLLAAATPCAVTSPAGCRDTNQLILAAGVRPMLRRFFGRMPRASLLYADGTLVEQTIEVLHGPPDAPTRIGPLWRFTACRAHSCPEKGAVVMTAQGRAVAVAILHSPCATPPVPPRCSTINLLTIYIRGAGPAVVADLRRWAAEAVAAQTINRAPPIVRVVRLG